MQLNHRFKMQPQARFIPRKLLLVMKLTVFLLTITFLQVSAKVFSQKINLKEKNVSIDKVLSQIQDQSGYEFFYNASALKQAGTVTINLKDATVQDALDQLFKDKPFSYSLDNNTITIKEKPTNFLDKLTDKVKEFVAATDITGRVMDENNQPLSGATVAVKGTNNVTTTDLNGFFTLKQVQPNVIILITFIGYDKKELPAVTNMGAIKLNTASSPLDEVKVMAYTRESERLSVSNAVTIKGEDIAKQPVNNPLLALEGKVPGLLITPTSGLPGAAVVVRINGQNSIQSSNLPLYVIDGIPYPSQILPTANLGPLGGDNQGSIATQGGSGSPLSFINPSDIESISVLSDADATAIYGSRAANGAIVIATKKGKSGPTQVNANFQQGWGRNTNEADLLNLQQYLQMRQEALKNDGIATPAASDYDINGTWDPTRFTDWQKQLIGRTAQYTNTNLNISGGTTNLNYVVGGTYSRQSTVFPGDYADQKGSFHFNLNSVSPNQRFKMQLTGSYLFEDNRLPTTDLTSNALTLAPDAPAMYNPDGTINWAINSTGRTTFAANPAALLVPNYERKSDNLISDLMLSYHLFKGLDVQVSGGYNNLEVNEVTTRPLNANSPSLKAILGANARSAGYSNSVNHSWIVEPQARYQRQIARGTLDALIGGTINQTHSNGINEGGSGYLSDALLTDFNSAASKSVNASVQSIYKYDAIFGRLNYNWQDKYVVNLNARRDGSSRFGSENEFHDFWSVGAGWIFTNEIFAKDNLSFLSFGKLKANYGTTGNDNIGDYQYLNVYTSSVPLVPYQGISGLKTNSLPNPFLQWEETHKLMIGTDLGFLKDRIALSVDYSRNRSSNELVGYILPSTTGFMAITENLPALVQNTAWQFQLNTTNIKSSSFKWTSSFNLTLPQNKLLAYPGLLNQTGPYVIGQPIGVHHAYHFLGVDPATGQYLVADNHGNPTTTPNPLTDQTALFNFAFPKYYGGFQNNFSYKNLSLDVFFQFSNQIKQNNVLGSFLPGQYNLNQPVSVLNRWQSPGNIASIERFNSNSSLGAQYNNALNSDAAYSNATYIRLKNLSLAYQLPAKWMQSAHLRNCSIYLRGENLLTFTQFKLLDPETGSVLPPLKILTAGIQIGL